MLCIFHKHALLDTVIIKNSCVFLHISSNILILFIYLLKLNSNAHYFLSNVLGRNNSFACKNHEDSFNAYK